MSENLKQRVRQQQLLIGPLITLGSTEIAEMMSLVGFDWLWIELEHAPMELSRAQELLQATAGRTPCVVRSPSNDSVWIKKVLDIGPDGIVIPQIRTADEAREAVRSCRYPPAGSRSVGIARAQQYGMSVQRYIEKADSELAIILQIEHIDSVRNIEAILSVDGYDAVFIGPYDLSASMGLTGQVSHPDVQQAVERIISACKKGRIPIGMFAGDAASAKSQIELGVTIVALGIDAMYLWKGAKAALDTVRSTKRNRRDDE